MTSQTTQRGRIGFTVFSKPWRDVPLEALADRMAGLGVDGIELPVRPGFQVEPDDAAARLPVAAQVFRDRGLRIASVAADVSERVLAGCAEAGVRVVRVMAPIPRDRGYSDEVESLRRQWRTLVPMLDRYGVTVGVQNHSGRYVTDALGLHHLLERFDPKHVAAIWDPGHNALQGDDLDVSLELVWPRLVLVNAKNAYWRRTEPRQTPAGAQARFQSWWTTLDDGQCDWAWVLEMLVRRGYCGDLCFSAEYGEKDKTDEHLRRDIAYAQRCIGAAASHEM